MMDVIYMGNTLPGRQDPEPARCLPRQAHVSRRTHQAKINLSRKLELGTSRLEQLDDVAGGVFEQDLGTAWAGENLVAEGQPGLAEVADFGSDVVDEEVDAVPAAGAWLVAVGHGPSGGAGRSAEQQPEVAAGDVRAALVRSPKSRCLV